MSYTIDLQKIADELDFDLEDIEMLFEVFLESAQESMKALEKAINENDLSSIFASSHAIKGSAANITLEEISNIAKDIESNAREENNINYLELYEKLKALIDGIEA
jgi:HPt (histidine-containing phosphotransfer) domain-containing protein